MWKDWLALSKKEQKGFIVLGIILIGLVIFNLLIPFFFDSGKSIKSENDELQAWIDSTIAINKKDQEQQKHSLFPFDPNKVSVTALKELGFSDKATVNLIKFRENGGTFSNPADILEIYGIDSALARNLIPFVKIETGQNNTSIGQTGYPKAKTASISAFEQNSKRIEKNVFIIEINSADTADFARLKGIGSTLSKRIVAFRKVLGGFYSTEQLKEVYGMPGSVINENAEHLKVDKSVVKKIDVNSASLRRLKSHPYISFYLARDIVEYREKNNGIKDMNEVLSLKEVTPELKNKLVEYLTVNNKTSRR